MTAIESAISEAMSNGWEPWPTKPVPNQFTLQNLDQERIAIYDAHGERHSTLYKRRAFLDPRFWQALGKAKGWSTKGATSIVWLDDGRTGECINEAAGQWLFEMHCFIDHLVDGRDIESFFADL